MTAKRKVVEYLDSFVKGVKRTKLLYHRVKVIIEDGAGFLDDLIPIGLPVT